MAITNFHDAKYFSATALARATHLVRKVSYFRQRKQLEEISAESFRMKPSRKKSIQHSQYSAYMSIHAVSLIRLEDSCPKIDPIRIENHIKSTYQQILITYENSKVSIHRKHYTISQQQLKY
ncbi:Hypothetical_protein [Hexamita inflata]|uniref:Hypothetical_protein n=1 Tax=Hexamita inflata TaxID=28002 RepID=A0AA86R5E2_9EUKA|nr:Hypothetical protein HINF_LOCUS58520 [Hexamita inflata]CAI9970878.1 Hypothetical protein HINF_LOCUS58523 [Hexamita inflata]CAI9970888.1 Hypothetical protein HINF_LOCUS58533 [Hexamita inflata]